MAVRDRFPGGEVMNLLFNHFEGFNEGIIGRESEMWGSMVKCGERLLEGGGMWNSPEVPQWTMVLWELWKTYR